MQNSELVLITGGNGAVGINCIHQLLKKEYHVRTTLRSLSRKDEVLAMLKTGGIHSLEKFPLAFKKLFGLRPTELAKKT